MLRETNRWYVFFPSLYESESPALLERKNKVKDSSKTQKSASPKSGCPQKLNYKNIVELLSSDHELCNTIKRAVSNKKSIVFISHTQVVYTNSCVFKFLIHDNFFTKASLKDLRVLVFDSLGNTSLSWQVRTGKSSQDGHPVVKVPFATMAPHRVQIHNFV